MLGGNTLMKTIFRVLMLGIIMSAVSAVSVFAQDVCAEVEAKQALYKQFTDNFADKTVEKRQVAIDAGKQYVGKYGACADDKTIVDYLNTNIPAMEKRIEGEKKVAATGTLYTNFDKAVEGSKTADIFSTGKQILGQEPDFLDVTLTLASAGFDQTVANPPVDTFNNDTVTYAKMAIQQIEANKPSKTGDYGVKQYSYKTDKFSGKDNALGLMNYNIGYILYYRQGKTDAAKKKEALPYLYKSTQYNAFSKANPFVYQTIGAWYLDEAIRMDSERQKAITAAGDKDTPETIAMLGVQKGYADRSIDAYARAYSLAKADPKNQAYATGLYTKLKELYAFRYSGKTDGIDTFVASVMSKPLPDPMTAITPVVEATPAATTTSGATKQAAMTSDDTSASSASTTGMTKSATTKSSATTDTKTTPSGTSAKPKTPAKKPAPKKKGTR
jgi:hypothetical protein